MKPQPLLHFIQSEISFQNKSNAGESFTLFFPNQTIFVTFCCHTLVQLRSVWNKERLKREKSSVNTSIFKSIQKEAFNKNQIVLQKKKREQLEKRKKCKEKNRLWREMNTRWDKKNYVKFQIKSVMQMLNCSKLMRNDIERAHKKNEKC